MSETSADQSSIDEAAKLLDKRVKQLRSLGLHPRQFDEAYEAAFKHFKRALYGGRINEYVYGPREIKDQLWEGRATAKHARLEFSDVIKDEASYKAILFRLLSGEKVWIPRSQIAGFDDSIILVSRWWLARNGYNIP